MIYLEIYEIIDMNSKFLNMPAPVINQNSLEYLVEYAKTKTDIAEIAALYTFKIITNHIFMNGNKRTGFLSALVFLLKNNKYVSFPVDESGRFLFFVEIPDKDMGLQWLTEWYKNWITDTKEYEDPRIQFESVFNILKDM